MKKMTTMDITHLLDMADEAAKEDQPVINFPLPKGCDTSGQTYMEIKDVKKKGKGFHAKEDLKAGTLLLVSKPIATIMGWEEDDFDGDMEEELDEDEEDEIMNSVDESENLMKSNQRNGVLAIKVAKAIQQNPSLWYNEISNLFPRDGATLPLWVCENAETGMQFERCINELENEEEFHGKKDVIEEIRQRLPFIVRYNCLSVETAPELFVYPDQAKGGHISLSATALYNEPSYFNHSHKPNVSRWSIGDIMFFVTNQDVKVDTELCISYIESELLCENSKRRSSLLEMDFEDLEEEIKGENESVDGKEDDDDGMEGPVINLDVQDELMNMHPLDRLNEINRFLLQTTGDCDPDDMDDDESDIVWFQCDGHRLRTLLALTFESLSQPSKALEQWKKCIEYVEKNLPPGDEAGIVIYVQAALCALCLSQESVARNYAAIALSNHNLIFGGGVKLFQRRYANEMELQLRSSKNALFGQAALDALWPVTA